MSARETPTPYPRRRMLAGLVALLGTGLAARAAIPAARAQDLNRRQHAPPGSNSKKIRVLTRARQQAAEQSQGLNRDTVNTDCSPVEIGNQQIPENGRLPRDEQVVVVPGDIINICR
ncbi:hypothetical protein KAJ83_08995 [Marivibrio halodurans]|uniref:Uncharacterized protein n=1 Tax=Marivibrio halodurans TaxID=2039722 RepID=A0A8J7V2A0_9PROT|nr:hypothetical protein [Marivibrio halodurans]MBP5857145.1 hypothetical protein [Marivibrio halodurans]